MAIHSLLSVERERAIRKPNHRAISSSASNEAVVAEIQGQEFMYMLMEGAESIGVWRLDGPGQAVLTQLWDVGVPIQFTGVTFGM